MKLPKKTEAQIKDLIRAYDISLTDFMIEGMYKEAANCSENIFELISELDELKKENNEQH